MSLSIVLTLAKEERKKEFMFGNRERCKLSEGWIDGLSD